MSKDEVKVEDQNVDSDVVETNDSVKSVSSKKSNNKSRKSGTSKPRMRKLNSNRKTSMLGSSPSNMNFRNYCGQPIAQLANNLAYTNNGFFLHKSDNPVNLSYSITYVRDDLWNQATVWSKQFLQHGNVRYMHLLGRDERFWEGKLIKLYIYSYFKMIVLGGNYQILNEGVSDSYMFTGHRIIYHILRTRRFGFEYEPGVYVNYNLDISKHLIDSIKGKLLDDFPFLNRCLVEDEGIGLNVIDRTLENLFSSIMDDSVYPQKVSISSLSENDPQISSVFKSDSIPLGNSFIRSDNSGYYCLIGSLQNVTDKSISISRACFITSSDQDTTRYYFNVPYNRRTIFAKHDASAITGINIRYEPKIPYNKGIVSQPVSFLDNSDLSPNQSDDTKKDTIMVNDQIKSETSNMQRIFLKQEGTAFKDRLQRKETQVDFNNAFEMFNKLNIKINGKLGPNDDTLPFDLNSKVDILSLIELPTLFDLLAYIQRYGARFYMDQYKFINDGIKTIDDKVTIKFVDCARGALIPVKDVFDIMTVAWFSRNCNKLFDFNNLQSWLSSKLGKVEGISKYEINKKYVITLYGNLYLSGASFLPPGSVDKGKF
jgi:hypothetical protein